MRLEAPEETLEIPTGEYLRMVELGRILVLHDDDQEALAKAFDTWFSPLGGDLKGKTVPISKIVERLHEGTLLPAVHNALKQRLGPFQQGWEKRLPGGLGFHLACGEGGVSQGES